MSRELKKYQLRATRRPAKNELVSSTVVVRNEAQEFGYCYVNFSPDFVDAVGKALPRGVSKLDPAHLEVAYYANTKVWLVKARYLHENVEVLLWKTAEKPSWLNFYKVKRKHDDHSQSPSCGGGTGTGG